MKKVYIAIGADILHPGHINVINEGAKYGRVIVGLLSDEAIEMCIRDSHKRFTHTHSVNWISSFISG